MKDIEGFEGLNKALKGLNEALKVLKVLSKALKGLKALKDLVKAHKVLNKALKGLKALTDIIKAIEAPVGALEPLGALWRVKACCKINRFGGLTGLQGKSRIREKRPKMTSKDLGDSPPTLLRSSWAAFSLSWLWQGL